MFFHSPYPATPLFATLMRLLHPGRFCGTKTAGVCTNNSQLGTRFFSSFDLRISHFNPQSMIPAMSGLWTFDLCFLPDYPLFLQPLAHSFARFCTPQKLNLIVFNPFRTLSSKTNCAGVASPGISPAACFGYNRAALCGTPQTHLLCGYQHKMSVPRCANEWSPVSGVVSRTFEVHGTSFLVFAVHG